MVGVDCEGLLRNQPIAMIQISFQEHSYLFDLVTIDPFNIKLKFNLAQILESPKVIKIFHDFVEDCAAL